MYLGISLGTWNILTLVFLGSTALAALVLFVAQRAVIILQDVAEKEAKQALEKYKSEAAAKISEANARGEEAKGEAAKANERAALLEKEAAQAKFETENLKAIVSWRVITHDEMSKLKEYLVSVPGSVNLRYIDGDTEALFLAVQLSKIIASAGWQVAPGAVKPPNSLVFGIRLPDSDGESAQTLRKAFTAAGIPNSENKPPHGGLEFSATTIPGAPTLMIGTKEPMQFP